VSDVFPKVPKLSSGVSECKPLAMGFTQGGSAAFLATIAAGAYTLPLFSST